MVFERIALALILLFLLAPARALPGARDHVLLDEEVPKFNLTLARTLVEYASAVYMSDPDALWAWNCTRCTDHTEGFQLVDLIIDVKRCLQAFVGVDEKLGAVVVAFRGTQENSVQNWAEDLYFRQLDFNYPGCTDALVHHGFYSAYHNTTLRAGVVGAVQNILRDRGDLSVMVTGHSMGGAMATLAALDLAVNYGLRDSIKVITFGSPRVGNPGFVEYYKSYVPDTIRMTHAHDLVPHLPPYYPIFRGRSYHHIPTEVWIYSYDHDMRTYDVFRVCDSSGEDPTCSRSVVGNSVADHLMYLGVFLKSEPTSIQGVEQGEEISSF